MITNTLLLVFIFLPSTIPITFTEEGIETNLPCAPRPIIQDTTATVHRAPNPRNLKLYKCSGFTGDPGTTRNMKCVPVKKNKHSVKYTTRMGRVTHHKEFENHTQCAMRCVCTLNGNRCTRDDLFHDVPCGENLKWNTGTCQCEAETGPKIQPCPGGTGDGVSVGVLVFALVGEMLVLVVVLFVVKKCRAKKVREDNELRDTLAADPFYRN